MANTRIITAPADKVSAAAFLWPVYGHRNYQTETVATFFNEWDAIDFALHPDRTGFDKRSIYCAEPRYDRRKSGYRPTERADLEPKELPGGRWSVAA